MSPQAQTHAYRLRAVICDRRAGQASDPAVKRDWEELAIEWHLLANASAKESGESAQQEIEIE